MKKKEEKITTTTRNDTAALSRSALTSLPADIAGVAAVAVDVDGDVAFDSLNILQP